MQETRLAHPERRIELRSEGACWASVDADRFEQVVSNLLGNALAHGDSARPILVHVAVSPLGVTDDPTLQTWRVCFGVRNYGPPIDPARLPLLFEPFVRERKASGHSAGLGIGIYISDRIVRAHGGSLRVTSSESEGTLFEALIPSQSRTPGTTPPTPGG